MPPGRDDVVIRLGAQNQARPAMRQMQGDLQELRERLQQLDGEEVDPEIRADVQAALAELDQLQGELRQLNGMDAEVQARADVGGASGDLGRIESELRRLDGQTAEMEVRVDADQASGQLSGMRSKLAGAATALGQGIGQAVGGAIMDAVSGAVATAIEQESSSAIAAARFAGDPETQRQAGAIAGRLYAQAYGDSLAEVQSAVFNVITSSAQMRDASQADIQAVAAAAMDLSTVWGLDVTESMRAVGQLVRTEMVPDSLTGLGLIDAAMRDLGPASDDALDTLTEYSTQFRQLGLDGPRAMQMLSDAIEAGAPSTDLAADALKEFTLIAQAMSDDTVAAYREIGLNGRQMGDDISAGGDRAAGALDLTLERLRGVKDPADQARLAVELFGTQAEDMQDALFAMDPTPTANAYTNLKGTLQEVSTTAADTTDNTLTEWSRMGYGTVVAFAQIRDAVNARNAEMAASTAGAATAMGESISRGVNTAVGTASGMPGRVAVALAGMYGRGSAAGTDLANGFQGGMQARAAQIAYAAQLMALNAVNAFRRAIGANSPAKKTWELGENFDEGYIGGMEAKRREVADKASQVALTAAEQLLPGGMPSLAGMGSGGQLAMAPAASAAGMVVDFSGATDSAFAQAFMRLVRVGAIQIRPTS